MSKRFYLVSRDLHLYAGLFLSPFLVAFAVSVVFLVHAWIPGDSRQAAIRTVGGVPIPEGLDRLSGREQVNRVHAVLDALGVKGEVNFIRRFPKENRLVVPVLVPGRETTVDLNLETRTASIAQRSRGASDAVVYLHKMPGPHNANIRGNSFYMRAWRVLADATVYLSLFLTLSGVYLWAVLRAERRIGLTLIAAGAFSLIGMVYALIY